MQKTIEWIFPRVQIHTRRGKQFVLINQRLQASCRPGAMRCHQGVPCSCPPPHPRRCLWETRCFHFCFISPTLHSILYFFLSYPNSNAACRLSPKPPNFLTMHHLPSLIHPYFCAVGLSHFVSSRDHAKGPWLTPTYTGAVTFFSFLWAVILCVIIYMQWDAMGRPQRQYTSSFSTRSLAHEFLQNLFSSACLQFMSSR